MNQVLRQGPEGLTAPDVQSEAVDKGILELLVANLGLIKKKEKKKRRIRREVALNTHERR